MDCEKFDELVMDALYGELDELTAASVRLHVDSCARCSRVWQDLRGTREGAVLPLVEPPANLEARILSAERAAQGRAPLHRKLIRAAAWAGSHAMRPQLAMAALFMFVIGSSLLLLRARPGTVSAPVAVSEVGAPENEAAAPAATSRAAAQAPAAAAPPPAKADRAKAEEAADLPSPARVAAGPEEPKAKGGDESAAARELTATLEEGAKVGCEGVVPKLELLAERYDGKPVGAAARNEIALCQRGRVAGAPAGGGKSAAEPKATSVPGSPSASATAAPNAP